MRTDRYKKAVAWIAENDEPHEMDFQTVVDMIPVLLIADVFDKTPEKVANDILKIRKECE